MIQGPRGGQGPALKVNLGFLFLLFTQTLEVLSCVPACFRQVGQSSNSTRRQRAHFSASNASACRCETRQPSNSNALNFQCLVPCAVSPNPPPAPTCCSPPGTPGASTSHSPSGRRGRSGSVPDQRSDCRHIGKFESREEPGVV